MPKQFLLIGYIDNIPDHEIKKFNLIYDQKKILLYLFSISLKNENFNDQYLFWKKEYESVVKELVEYVCHGAVDFIPTTWKWEWIKNNFSHEERQIFLKKIEDKEVQLFENYLIWYKQKKGKDWTYSMDLSFFKNSFKLK